MKIFIKDFFSKCDQTADLVTFTEEILNRKLHFLCSDIFYFFPNSAIKPRPVKLNQ